MLETIKGSTEIPEMKLCRQTKVAKTEQLTSINVEVKGKPVCVKCFSDVKRR